MRFHSIITAILPALVITACASRKAAHVEVWPKLSWNVRDYGRAAGAFAGPYEVTNYCVTNIFAPFVVSQGVPFTMDFARHDALTSPDTGKTEPEFDGVVARLTVVVSNSTAFFSGRIDYRLDLGVTSSYYDDDSSLYGETLRSFSTSFSGTCALGHEMQIGAGEDINDEPFVSFIFRQTSAPPSTFTPKLLNDAP